MKITIETIGKDQVEEILIRCHEVTDEIVSYVNSLKMQDNELIGYNQIDIHRLSFSDVYYFEAVDNKVFIYCESKVYESKQKLYELEQLCESRRFFRCSKSTILNIEKITLIRPSLSGRFEAVLDNEETVIVSRQYVPKLKNKLGWEDDKMKKIDFLGTMIRNYFIIFTIIILGTALLNPTHSFTFREIMLSALFALAGDLPSIVFYSKKELSNKNRNIRIVIHFLLLEVVILTFGNIMGQVSGVKQTALFGLEILGIYILVGFFSWLIDRKTANDINQKLENMRSEKKE